jgi:peptidyl-Asp metalloendopeptidase
VLNAIESTNAVYLNSNVPMELRLVYSGPITYTETTISADLSALRSPSDGNIDQVHALRMEYRADIVSMFGTSYRNAGYCGIGYLMTSVSTSFASSAFNVVDYTCAVGNLSFAHEVGHNEGLHHDPANAGSTPSHPFAYGYQDPSGLFRTVMSYGGARRIPYLSSPLGLYNGVPTGTDTQDNARALRLNAATVASFLGDTQAVCTYTVSATQVNFTSNGGSKSFTVTTNDAVCPWTVSTSDTWFTVSPTSGAGTRSITVTVPANLTTTSFSGTIVVNNTTTITVTQSGRKGRKSR